MSDRPDGADTAVSAPRGRAARPEPMCPPTTPTPRREAPHE